MTAAFLGDRRHAGTGFRSWGRAWKGARTGARQCDSGAPTRLAVSVCARPDCKAKVVRRSLLPLTSGARGCHKTRQWRRTLPTRSSPRSPWGDQHGVSHWAERLWSLVTMVQPSLPWFFTSRLPALIMGSMVKHHAGLQLFQRAGAAYSAKPGVLRGISGRCRVRRTRAPPKPCPSANFWMAWPMSPSRAPGRYGMPVPHGFREVTADGRLDAIGHSPVGYMRLLSPRQPSQASILTVHPRSDIAPFSGACRWDAVTPGGLPGTATQGRAGSRGW